MANLCNFCGSVLAASAVLAFSFYILCQLSIFVYRRLDLNFILILVHYTGLLVFICSCSRTALQKFVQFVDHFCAEVHRGQLPREDLFVSCLLWQAAQLPAVWFCWVSPLIGIAVSPVNSIALFLYHVSSIGMAFSVALTVAFAVLRLALEMHFFPRFPRRLSREEKEDLDAVQHFFVSPLRQTRSK